MKDKIIILAAFLLILFGPAGCRTGGIEPELAPSDEQFLSQVRYVITSEERRAFLRLSDSERPQFIEEFWKRRDLNPDTPENEVKVEYFKRLSEAGKLFLGEGREGWLTDRGRIYILYGPPNERQTGAISADASGHCREIWYYGNFPVVFADPECRGSFSLATVDLSRIDALSLALATTRGSIRAQLKKDYANFDVRLKKKTTEESRFEGVAEIEVPYASIWFGAEGGMLKTVLELKMELKDSQNVVRWQHQSRHEVALTAQELGEKKGEKYLIEIPLIIEKEAAELRQGRNKLEITLENTTGKERIHKVVEFSLE